MAVDNIIKIIIKKYPKELFSKLILLKIFRKIIIELKIKIIEINKYWGVIIKLKKDFDKKNITKDLISSKLFV